jgi:multidrug transporter EmrE-like cation transporter
MGISILMIAGICIAPFLFVFFLAKAIKEDNHCIAYCIISAIGFFVSLLGSGYILILIR